MHVRAAGGLARPSSENEGRVPPGDARETCDSPAGGVRNRAAGDFSVSSAFSVVHDLELAFVQEQTMSKVPMTVAGAERLRREPGWLLCSTFGCEPCTLRKRRLRAMGRL